MSAEETTIKKARFDTRLAQEQKDLFERAAQLGGYRSLTDFVIAAVEEKARTIIVERERVLASKKDAEIFFSAILEPKKPNKELTRAAKEYKAVGAK